MPQFKGRGCIFQHSNQLSNTIFHEHFSGYQKKSKQMSYFNLKSSSLWVSALPKSSSFWVSRFLKPTIFACPCFLNLGSGFIQNELDFKWKIAYNFFPSTYKFIFEKQQRFLGSVFMSYKCAKSAVDCNTFPLRNHTKAIRFSNELCNIVDELIKKYY